MKRKLLEKTDVKYKSNKATKAETNKGKKTKFPRTRSRFGGRLPRRCRLQAQCFLEDRNIELLHPNDYLRTGKEHHPLYHSNNEGLFHLILKDGESVSRGEKITHGNPSNGLNQTIAVLKVIRFHLFIYQLVQSHSYLSLFEFVESDKLPIVQLLKLCVIP